MKHAYLIMAHNQFLTLKELVSVLDDSRNDIYVHFDRKVKTLPTLETRHSRLVILDERVDVVWGDVSQIQAEYALYRAAFEPGKYSYYHLISGVHFPLMSNDDLHQWFDDRHGACILREVPLPEEEIQMRFGRYHFFLKHLISRNRFVNKAYHLGWRGALKLQKVLGIRRDTSFIKGKASQWCSLNEEAVSLLLAQEKTALKRFRRTSAATNSLSAPSLKTRESPSCSITGSATWNSSIPRPNNLPKRTIRCSPRPEPCSSGK